MTISTRKSILIAIGTVLSSLAVGFTVLLTTNHSATTAASLDLSLFRAGNIIDDAVFTNYNSMSVADIQNFLNARIPGGCTPNHTPTCIRDFTENGRTAAQIIWDTAQEFRINPQVLIVKIQKEQGLITNPAPAEWMYRTATGYGCPDSTPGICDSQFWGFTNQVRWTGRMFRAIMNNSPTWWTPHRLGWNQVFYHPDLQRCGSSAVYIENRATVALYAYTPYQPNAAARAAGFGRGDSCSAYGNRNFWLFFRQWFGDTHHLPPVFSPMAIPRSMQVRSDSPLINADTGDTISIIPADTILLFNERANSKGRLCLRTDEDTRANNRYCILFTNLSEIGADIFEPMVVPRTLRAVIDTHEISATTGNFLNPIPRGQVNFFSTRTAVDGRLCLRRPISPLEESCIPIHHLEDFTVSTFTPMLLPRPMQPIVDARQVNITTSATSRVNSETPLIFTHRATWGNDLCLRTRESVLNNENICVFFSDLKEVTFNNHDFFTPMAIPRALSTRGAGITKINIFSLERVEPLHTNQIIEFTERKDINGRLCLRTRADTEGNRPTCIFFDDLNEL